MSLHGINTYMSIYKYWSMWKHPIVNIAIYSFEIDRAPVFLSLMRSPSPDHPQIACQSPF